MLAISYIIIREGNESIDGHIRVIDDCINQGLSFEFLDVLQAFSLNLTNGFQAKIVLQQGLRDWGGEKVSHAERDKEVFPNYSAVENVGHLHTKSLLH